MKRLLVFMLLAVLIISCSSKKILLVRKIAHNGVINNIASQYDFSQNQHSTINNSKNSSVKNLPKVGGSITTIKNNQDFLASKDKVGPTALTSNYSYRKLPHFIQQEKINKSFLGKVPILESKENTKKKSKVKEKQYKILFILLFILCGIMTYGMFIIAYNLYMLEFPILAAVFLLMSIVGLIGSISILKALKKGGRGKSKRGLY